MITYVQAGWWIPGKLQQGWGTDIQASYNDMAAKLRQLKLSPLVAGQTPFQELGFYYSQADYDFFQLLSASDPAHGGAQNARTIVAYSCWLGARGWASTSPVPILVPANAAPPLGVEIPNRAKTGGYSVAGWYLLGKLDGDWYADVAGNLAKATARRASLGLRDASPLYFTQTAVCHTIQILQSRWTDSGCQDFDAIQQYVDWWGAQGFGVQRAIPFMTLSLVGKALFTASETP
jgi:hypothetical protein